MKVTTVRTCRREVMAVPSRKGRRMTMAMHRDRLLALGTLPCPNHFQTLTRLDPGLSIPHFKKWINDYFELTDINLRCIRIGMCEEFLQRTFSASQGCWMLTVVAEEECGTLTTMHPALLEASKKLKGIAKIVPVGEGKLVLCVTSSHEACV